MKKACTIALALFVSLSLSNCNAFGWMEPTTDHFDRCRSLNDKGDYDGAIAECEKADPNDENIDVQLELADAHLAALGVRIAALSDIFLNASEGTETIVSLAESLIEVGSLNAENHDASIVHATEAYDAFKNYGDLLVVQDPADGPEIAAFYKTLAAVSVVSVTMAYADILSTAPNGLIEKADVCNPLNTNCVTATQVTMCINDPASPFYSGVTCEGMPADDSEIAAGKLIDLGNDLAAMNLPDLEEAVKDLIDITVLEPGGGSKKISESGYQTDAGRELLRSIARD